jgi:hypothetical protein
MEYLSCFEQMKTMQAKETFTKHAEHSVCHLKALWLHQTTCLLRPPVPPNYVSYVMEHLSRWGVLLLYTLQLQSNNFINIIISELILLYLKQCECQIL